MSIAMRGEDAHFFNEVMRVNPGIMDHVEHCIAPPAPLPRDTLDIMPPATDSGECVVEPKQEYDVNDEYQTHPTPLGPKEYPTPLGPKEYPTPLGPLQTKDAFPPALKDPASTMQLSNACVAFDPTDANAMLNNPAMLADPFASQYMVDVPVPGTRGCPLPNSIPPRSTRAGRAKARRGPVDVRKLSQGGGMHRGPVDIRKLGGGIHDGSNIPPMDSDVFPEDKAKKSLAGLPSKLLELGVSKRLTKLDRLSRMDDRNMSSKQKAEKRRLMRLEKNRRAAAISRERKKRYIRSLEERSLIMSKHLQVLEMENSQLRALLAQSSNGQELLDTMPPHMSPLPEMSLGLPTDQELFPNQFGVGSPTPHRSPAADPCNESMKWSDPSELKAVFCPNSRKKNAKKRQYRSDEEDFAFNGAAAVATAGSSTKLSIKLDDPYPTTALKPENPKRERYQADHDLPRRIQKKKRVGYY